MRAIIAGILLLAASTAWAGGPEMLLVARQTSCSGLSATAINCISSISSAGTQDTGTASGMLAAGDITAIMTCAGTSGAYAALAVDGTLRDVLICNAGNSGKTLTYTVSAGTHTVRIYGDNSSGGTFEAHAFSLPMP